MRRCALLIVPFPLRGSSSAHASSGIHLGALILILVGLSAYIGSALRAPRSGGDAVLRSTNGGVESVLTASPILISLNKKNAYELTSAKDGVSFDIDGDGVPDEVAWTRADSQVAFLARDLDGDGQITSGKELFGNYTYPGVKNGFDALLKAARDSNGSHGSISSDDRLFASLLLWTDTNHNGISERWELQPASTGLAEIGLGYAPSDMVDAFGNRFAFRGWASERTAPGRNAAKSAKEDQDRRIYIWDVYLRVNR